MLYASVLLPVPLEGSFSYIVPERLSDSAVKGVRCIVPFGKRKMTGYILSVDDVRPMITSELKEIERIIDKEPVFNDDLVDIAYWMKTMYFSPAGLNLSMMVPSGRRESEVSPFFEVSSFKAIETLTAEQEHALEVLRTSRDRVFYIYGVTGSGKSEVYLRRAEDIIRKGSQVLYLVPEITLSEQLSDEVYERFSGKVAILHSSLTPSQRLKAWHGISSGEIKLVIGARSSVFAPFSDLGLIIIDEEHETSYKSGNTPRYHARQVAQYRAAKSGAQLVMGSATPSLEAWKLMHEQAIHRIDMRKRAGKGAFPHISVVSTLGAKRNITPALEDEIRRTLASKRQVLLFLNRRGYTYGYACNTCGSVITCPHCSVSMTYHKKTNRLVCHTCGYSSQPVRQCPECGSHDLSPHGYGTENIEEEARALFPDARICRLDSDSAVSREALSLILHEFREGKTDILLGTQMIAKGLNFPGVSLVGVLNADSSLAIPDFRASERTFDLLHQVAGRAGRYSDDGIVIIQTAQPLAPAVKYTVSNDPESFYSSEMMARKETLFPPFTRIVNLTVRGKNEEKVIAFASEIEEKADSIVSYFPDVEVFPASPCLIEKKAQYYRYHILLRCTSMRDLLSFASRLLSSLAVPSSLYLEVDTDPVSIM